MAIGLQKVNLFVLAFLGLAMATMACSLWVGDRRILGDATATRQPATTHVLVAVTATRQPISPSPTLAARVTAVRSLHVRERAGEGEKVIGYLYSGNPVLLTGECTDNGWAEIVWEGGTAWVNADYLSDNLCRK